MLKAIFANSGETTRAHTDNPYLAARREWDERYGDLLTRARNWRTMAFLSCLVALIAADESYATQPRTLKRTQPHARPGNCRRAPSCAADLPLSAFIHPFIHPPNTSNVGARTLNLWEVRLVGCQVNLLSCFFRR